MSVVTVVKEADVLILGTDSRFMKHDFSSVDNDSSQKIFKVAEGTYIAPSGRKIAVEFQVERARVLVAEMGTADILAIGAALERDSYHFLDVLVERLKSESDETTRQAVSGDIMLHGCMLVGRSAGKLGFVQHAYSVQADGTIKCTTEAYFDGPRKITSTSGTPASLLAEIASRFAYFPPTWTDPIEQVSVRFMEALKSVTPTIGGPWQVLRLDTAGAHWINRPPQAAVPLAGNLAAATITAAITIMAPTISGGAITGASITSTLNGVVVEANGTYDATLGLYTGLRVKSAATPNYRAVIVPGGIWLIDSSNVVRAQVFADGTITLHDAAGASRVILDAANGQLLMIDSSGNTRAQMDTFGGAGHISVSGTGASIQINGRSL